MDRVSPKGRRADDTMAEPLDSNSLELRMAFHNAVSRFQDWTANVAEPRVKLRGKFCPISEVCEEVANLSNQLPEFILSVLCKETKADDDVLALERGRIVSALASNAGLARLVEVQYVTKHLQSERKTLYIITDLGRQALANAAQ